MSLKPLTILTDQSYISKVTFTRVTSVKSSASNADISALSASEKKVAKVVPAETAETGLQKAEGTTLQFYFGLLKLQKLLLIVSQLFAEISADT